MAPGGGIGGRAAPPCCGAMITFTVVPFLARPPPLRARRPPVGRVPPFSAPPSARATRPPPHFEQVQDPPCFMPPTCLVPARDSFADLTSRLIRELAVRPPPLALPNHLPGFTGEIPVELRLNSRCFTASLRSGT